MRILVTGCAGFIGYHFCRRLISENFEVIGVDNLDPYYSVSLKKSRLNKLKQQKAFSHYLCDVQNKQDLESIFQKHDLKIVVHLAAQAGVRYSIENPRVYIDSNIVGFMNILESCRQLQIEHLVYASSSSVYGLNSKIPFSTQDDVNHPISLYAATKKSNELMAHSYSHLYGIPTTGLRFFTVYGPWGRPDMALFLFANKIMKGESIQVFNHGKMRRDFTYIDDIVEGTFRIMKTSPKPKPNWIGSANESSAPYRIYNIGSNQPIELLYFIEVLEKSLGKRAIKEMLPIQPGDVTETYAEMDDLISEFGFKPTTSIEEGIENFADWFQWYYSQ